MRLSATSERVCHARFLFPIIVNRILKTEPVQNIETGSAGFDILKWIFLGLTTTFSNGQT